MEKSSPFLRTAALALVLVTSGLAVAACGSVNTPTRAAPDNDVGVNPPFIGLNGVGQAEAAMIG
jgi:hypothetical protein